MNKQTNITAEGVVIEALPNTMFRVQLHQDSPESLGNKVILCTLAGKMRLYRIKVMPGDMVKCELSLYDTDRGRIVFRSK